MKKGLIIAAAMILAVCLGVGGTLAYLFVKTETVTNTFAPSNITLELEETVSNQFQMIPSVEMKKDPKVTASGDIDFYVFVKVDKVNNPDTYLDYSIITTEEKGWEVLETGTNYVVYYQEVAANATFEDVSILTGDKVTTKSTITKGDMAKFYNSDGTPNEATFPKLIFTAYAIQKAGFTPATAWTELNKA